MTSAADYWKSRLDDYEPRPLVEAQLDVVPTRGRLPRRGPSTLGLARSVRIFAAYPPPFARRAPRQVDSLEFVHQELPPLDAYEPFEKVFEDGTALGKTLREARDRSLLILRVTMVVGPNREQYVQNWPLLYNPPALVDAPVGAGAAHVRVRRWDEPAGERSVPASLPVHVVISAFDDDARLPEDDALFDDMVRGCRDLGAIRWERLPFSRLLGQEPGGASIFHLIRGRDALHELVDTTWRLRWGNGHAPRLVVLHQPGRSAEARPEAPLQWVDACMSAGADAALFVASDEPDAAGFFGIFYRALMHNRPIDEAAARALSTREGSVYASLTLRQQAEFGLSLTHAVGEADLAMRAKAHLTRSRMRGAFEPFERGPRGPSTKSFGFESFTPDETEPRGQSALGEVGARAKRVASWVRGAVSESTEAARRFKESALEKLDGLKFRARGPGLSGAGGAEASDLRAVLDAHARLQDEWRLGELEAVLSDDATAAAAAARSTVAWLEGEAGVLPVEAALPVGGLHWLAVAVRATIPEEGARVSALLFEGLLSAALALRKEVELDVVAFANEAEIAFDMAQGGLRLPVVGDSDVVKLPFRTKREGLLRVRVVIYFERRVLQSLALGLWSGAEAPPAGHRPRTPEVDWAATTDFARLEALPPVDASIVVNDDPAGTHWFMARDRQGGPLIRTYPDEALVRVFRPLTKALEDAIIGGWGGRAFDPAEPNWQDRAEALVEIAKAGWGVYHTLFQDLLAGAWPAPGEGGVLTVARCHFASANPPWAALYRLQLQSSGETGLCPKFQAMVEGNRWEREPVGGIDLLTPRAPGRRLDLFEQEKACRASSDCPLSDQDRAEYTVCPFGFLGVRGIIEQPLQDVPGDSGATRLKDPEFTLPTVLEQRGGERVLVRVGFDSALDPALAREHARRLAELFAPLAEQTDDRKTALAWLRRGGSPFLYFFCHGEPDAFGVNFRLRFGGSFIGPSDVGAVHAPGASHGAGPSPAQPWGHGALVMLNGCDTVAPTASSLGGFVSLLRLLGAVAVVGTETPVYSPIASEFGLRLLGRLGAGSTLGEAMLELRRAYFWQLNPIGLVYTFYASAQVHLHAKRSVCGVCDEGAEVSARPRVIW